MSTAQTFGPYSAVRRMGNMYFVSGQVGVHPETKVAPESVEAQTRQALDNMRALLQAEGLSMNRVAKTTIYVTYMGDFAAVYDVYVTYFDEPRPARATVAAAELPRVGGDVPIKVEIEAIAIKEPAQ
jgi:2-iminobutanoate/2-iminopropanoate deaminase